MKTLEGKVAFITGGSRSLGLSIARTLIDQGANVVITARTSAALDQARVDLGDRALALQMDVRDSASVKAAFAATHDRFGRLDILVNNAAVGCLHRIDQASDEELKTQVETNLLGVIYAIREAVPLMRQSGGGDIVNVSSESVRLPFPMLSVYAATKAAVECLTAGLRDELRPDHIRIGTLRCGNIAQNSGFGDSWSPEVKADAFELWKTTGHLAFAGQPIPQEVAADALLAMINTPASGGLDLVEIRGR